MAWCLQWVLEAGYFQFPFSISMRVGGYPAFEVVLSIKWVHIALTWAVLTFLLLVFTHSGLLTAELDRPCQLSEVVVA